MRRVRTTRVHRLTVPNAVANIPAYKASEGPLTKFIFERRETFPGTVGSRRYSSFLLDADPGNSGPLPVDLVSASASGLDPDISAAGAYYQAQRVARARGVKAADVQALIAAHERGRMLGFLGERRVNVLELNLALDHVR